MHLPLRDIDSAEARECLQDNQRRNGNPERGRVDRIGEPHIHITLSSPAKGAFGGHLENGCRVLYLAEVTIVKYSGPSLIRKLNSDGVSLLQAR